MYSNWSFELNFRKICSRNLADWQHQSASLHTTEFYTEFWRGLPWEISITSYLLQKLLQFTVASSWAFLLKPWVWQAYLSFHHSANMLPCTFPQANLAKMYLQIYGSFKSSTKIWSANCKSANLSLAWLAKKRLGPQIANSEINPVAKGPLITEIF